MSATTAEKVIAVIIGVPSIGGLLTLLPEVATYGPGNPTGLLWRLLTVTVLVGGIMWLIGSHASESIARTFTIGVLGGVPTLAWYLTVDYGMPELVGIVIAVLVSTVGTMAVVIMAALIHDELRRRIAGTPY
jgi:hypothetical protein